MLTLTLSWALVHPSISELDLQTELEINLNIKKEYETKLKFFYECQLLTEL